MNISKYLKKIKIDIIAVDKKQITIKHKDQNTHVLNIEDIERYLFICLMDYINEEINKNE